MPNMFSRRRGNSATPPVDRGNVSAAAATAAGAAFRSRASSVGPLSSAAAAAALRSHTSSPEPVGSIQTKRMVRRGSGSSTGGGSIIGSSSRGGVGRGGLQRRDSNASMTERTFRSPSPGRGPTPVSAAPDAPPVPYLPPTLRGGHKRSASQEPVARVTSPTPRGTRGMSVDRGSVATPKSTRRPPRLSNVQEAEDSSPGSVNFSRPRSTLDMPSVKPGMRPSSSQGVRQSEATGTQSSISATAGKPVKKRQDLLNAAGSHFAQANGSATAPTRTALDTADTIMVYDPNSRTFVAKPRPKGSAPPRAQSPLLPTAPEVQPGAYDPSTRTIAPTSVPARQGSLDFVQKTAKPNPAVTTTVSPPPRNPARVSTSPEPPVSPRAMGALHHQPSIVREDPEAESAAEASTSPNPRTPPNNTINTSAGPAKRYVAGAISHNRSASLDVPRAGSVGSTRGRGNSQSPSRTARFSASPILVSERHEPLRGVSPAKSAMKHSPSSSIRALSPSLRTSPLGKSSSEDPDSPSTNSPDGFPKSKKSVRVKFDEEPHELGKVATPEQAKPIGRERSPALDDDMEELMQPRPALPLFGSVRRNREQVEAPVKVTERPPPRHESSSDNVVGSIIANDAAKKNQANAPLPPQITPEQGRNYSSDSSDDEASTPTQAAGATTAKPHVPAQASAAAGDGESVPAINLQPPTPGIEEESRKLGGVSPPATPKPQAPLEEFAVPGSWGKDNEEADARATSPAPTADASADSARLQGLAKQRAAAFVAAPAASDAVSEHAMPDLSDINETESDDNAAFSDAAEDFSDQDGGFASLDAMVKSTAPTSPVMAMSPSPPPESPSVRKATKTNIANEDDPATPTGDWTNATAYWSQLSKQQRAAIERDHMSSDDERTPRAVVPKVKKKKSALKQSPTTNVAQSDQGTDQTSAATDAQAQLPPALKKTMRAQNGPQSATPGGQVHMRGSMRDAGSREAPVTMRSSMRGAPAPRPQSEVIPTNGTLQKKTMRPISASSAVPPPAPQQSSQIPGRPAASAPKVAPPLRTSKQVPVNNDSDSESSFRKARRPSASTVDAASKVAMKRSMRAGSIDSAQVRPVRPSSPVPAGKGRGSFSVRSLSPTGSFFGRNRQNLKESMRTSTPQSSAKTMRGPNSMGKPQPASAPRSAPARPASSASGMTSRFHSRFNDSDDEDEPASPAGRPMFRSRFVDSDDDEPASPKTMTTGLTPVRGIPRRKGQEDGDSTELSDEDEDPRKASRKRTKPVKPIVPDPADVEKAMAAARRNLGFTNGSTSTPNAKADTEGATLAQGSLRNKPTELERTASTQSTPSTPIEVKQKRGFMGSLLRRNRNSSISVQQVRPMSLLVAAPATPTQQSPAAPPMPLSTTATKAKLIRRGSAQPQARPVHNRGESFTSTATAPAGPASRIDEESWPLPALPKFPARLAEGDNRPNTADGIHEQAVKLARTMRPTIGRRSLSGTFTDVGDGRVRERSVGFAESVVEPKERTGVYSARTGRKKKFGLLRRAFGIYD